MSHDVYGSNLPTFVEFFGSIAVPVAVMLLVLAGLGWGTLRKSHEPRDLDTVLWFLAGLGITIFFGIYCREKLGVDEYFFGSIGVAWLIVLTGMGVDLLRLRRKRGFWSVADSVAPAGCVLVLMFLFFPAVGDAREAARPALRWGQHLRSRCARLPNCSEPTPLAAQTISAHLLTDRTGRRCRMPHAHFP
jgi:hypothetical protein